MLKVAVVAMLCVVQPAGPAWSEDCSFELAPSSVAAPAAGLDDAIAIGASAVDCPWSAVSDVGWVQITGDSSGVGDGQLDYHVDENLDVVERLGHLGVEGKTVTITQSGAPCAGPPEPFALRSPADGAVEVSPTDPAEIGLTWDAAAGATSYLVYFGEDPLPPPVAELPAAGAAVTATWGTTYHWKVDAKNACGTTPAADGVRQFVAIPDCALGDAVNHAVAAFYAPLDGSDHVRLIPEFRWQCSALADDRTHQAAVYRVRVNDQYLGVYSTVCETSETMCVSELELAENTTWWVHVWAYDETGLIIGDTLYVSFTTGNAGDIFIDGFEGGDATMWSATWP